MVVFVEAFPFSHLAFRSKGKGLIGQLGWLRIYFEEYITISSGVVKPSEGKGRIVVSEDAD